MKYCTHKFTNEGIEYICGATNKKCPQSSIIDDCFEIEVKPCDECTLFNDQDFPNNFIHPSYFYDDDDEE